MDDTITTTYYLCDEFLKAVGHRDDPQARLSTAEVMTVALVAAAFFGGNIEASRSFLDEYGYIGKSISKSRFNRRLHAIDPCLWERLFALLAEVFKHEHPEQTYVVDSLPVAVCDNIRIRRCRLYPPQEHAGAFRGYIPSKRRYFYGLRVHLVVTGAGEPVEFSLVAGSEADVSVFKDLELDLPGDSIILADKAYTDYDYEDLLEVWPKSHARSMVPELLTNRRVADKRQIAIISASRAETFVEMIAPGWLRSRMRPVFVATSVRLATVAVNSTGERNSLCQCISRGAVA